jgi:hypothetical protein
MRATTRLRSGWKHGHKLKVITGKAFMCTDLYLDTTGHNGRKDREEALRGCEHPVRQALREPLPDVPAGYLVPFVGLANEGRAAR